MSQRDSHPPSYREEDDLPMTDLHEQRARVAGLFDQLAPGYDQGGVPWFGPIASRLVELLAPRPGERAADIGAGRGAATFPLLDAVGPDGHVTAVDLSPAMGEHLRADAATRGVGNLDVHTGDVSDAGLEPGSFDVVTASLVLFFDPDPGITLRSWVGLVRPGSGRIGITTFGPVDPAWQRAEAAVLRHAPATMLDPRTSGTRGPFASTRTMAALLAEAGAVAVESHDEPLEVVLPDARAWQAWTMTLGMRQVWEAVPATDRDRVLAAAAESLEADRADDGLLHLTQQVRYTTGRVA